MLEPVDFLGYVALTAVGVSMIGVAAFSVQASRSTQIAILTGLAAWFGFGAAAGFAGWLAATGTAPPMVAFVLAPLLAAGLAGLTVSGRRVMTSLPLQVILGLNIARVLGICFVVMGWQGRLSGPFPVSAGWGDVLTGLGALILIAGRLQGHRGLVLAWNLFGLADLVAAIAIGILSAEGSPLQLIHAAPGSAAMQTPPWSFVPSVLVPYWIVMHLIVLAQLRRKPAAPV